MTGEVFIDTSALYAVLDRDDSVHDDAARRWQQLVDQRLDCTVPAVRTHSGVLIEATALVQHRLGLDTVRTLLHDLLGIVEVEWVDARLHERASTALLAAGKRSISLVDWTSFELMRARDIEVFFAFDDDFTAQGFTSGVG